MKRHTVEVTWAEVVQCSATVTVNANRADDAVAVATAWVRNTDVTRRAINAMVTKTEAIESSEPIMPQAHMIDARRALPEPGPGRRNHHEGEQP